VEIALSSAEAKVRDSKDPAQPVQYHSVVAWRAFLTQLGR
jgi:hypothetical protein